MNRFFQKLYSWFTRREKVPESPKARVIYNGVSVVAEWPAKIVEAQEQPTIWIAGVECVRVRYGAEADDWGAGTRPCHDCAVVKGQIHVLGCDVERCPKCGGQLISCECDDEDEEAARVKT